MKTGLSRVDAKLPYVASGVASEPSGDASTTGLKSQAPGGGGANSHSEPQTPPRPRRSRRRGEDRGAAAVHHFLSARSTPELAAASHSHPASRTPCATGASDSGIGDGAPLFTSSLLAARSYKTAPAPPNRPLPSSPAMLLPPLSLRELMPAASLANPESAKDGDAATPPLRTPAAPSGTAPLSQLQDVLLGLILALSLLSLGCGLWLWLRFRRGAARHAGAVVLPSHVSEASTPGSTSTFSLPSPPPHAYPPSPHRVLVLGSPPDAGGWVIQQKEDPDDDDEKGDTGRMGQSDAGSEIYAIDIANGAWAPSPPHGVLYFAGQRLQVMPARPVTPPPSIFVTPPGRSKWSPRRE